MHESNGNSKCCCKANLEPKNLNRLYGFNSLTKYSEVHDWLLNLMHTEHFKNELLRSNTSQT